MLSIDWLGLSVTSLSSLNVCTVQRIRHLEDFAATTGALASDCKKGPCRMNSFSPVHLQRISYIPKNNTLQLTLFSFLTKPERKILWDGSFYLLDQDLFFFFCVLRNSQ
ncbi:hypothetical protein AVEN_172807-1 [Araneus ventricosus]|uniref:Uncharacterized protein n=1 Tax=Araneus ventricosus TaxID=182803 RepID=A0A4Y2BI14_ARAVE|nr:hypothetical protein AVEN_172807-1 [Araneus ventricosus]